MTRGVENGSWVVGFRNTISNTLKNMENEKKRYAVKCFRLDERTWEKIRKNQKRFGKSWNLFINELVNVYERNSR